MGRVYDALRRANTATNEKSGDSSKVSTIGDDRRQANARPGQAELIELLDRRSAERPFYSVPTASRIQESASTAHTEERTGSALSGVPALRSAGATLDAVGSTRAALGCVSIDISPARVEPHLVAITQPRSAYCEHFRALRTRVLHASQKKNLQAFVITSAGVSEGKTLTTMNLAWMLAQTDGVRALLIDSDLRRPCVTNYLGIEERQGLSEVLADEAKLEDCFVRLYPSGLYLLPGGAPRENVAELLSGPRFGRVLGQARRMFDYILIDAPPLGIFTDAAVLINRADAALMVVRAGKTRYSVVDRLLGQLPRERMLGVVVNGSEEEITESDYYYDRQKHYKRIENLESRTATVLQGG